MTAGLVILAAWMLVTVYQAWAWARALRRLEDAIRAVRTDAASAAGTLLASLPRKRVRRPKATVSP